MFTGPRELDMLPEKIEITVPLSFEKIAHLLVVRAGELASARYSCALYGFLSKY